MTKQQIEREALKLFRIITGRNPTASELVQVGLIRLARHVLRRVERARLEGKHDAMKADEPNHFDVA